VFPATGTVVLPVDVIGVFKPDDLAVINCTKDAATLKPTKCGNSDDVEIGDIITDGRRARGVAVPQAGSRGPAAGEGQR
jgi:hypothetical protein